MPAKESDNEGKKECVSISHGLQLHKIALWAFVHLSNKTLQLQIHWFYIVLRAQMFFDAFFLTHFRLIYYISCFYYLCILRINAGVPEEVKSKVETKRNIINPSQDLRPILIQLSSLYMTVQTET